MDSISPTTFCNHVLTGLFGFILLLTIPLLISGRSDTNPLGLIGPVCSLLGALIRAAWALSVSLTRLGVNLLSEYLVSRKSRM